jgi:5-methylcytosine-specific restriction endonuclease McrA
MRRHLIARDGLTCARCGDPIEREVPSIGHRIAVANGGGDSESNLGLEHLTCNRRAGTAGFFNGDAVPRQSSAAPNGAEIRPIARRRARLRLIRPDFEV